MATAMTVVLMCGVWLVAVRIRNAGIVDIAWAASFAAIALLFAVLGAGAPLRRLVVLLMVSAWSLRLAAYLYRRVMGHHPVEDARYQDLRARWAPNADARFFWFFQVQALAAVALSVPFALAAANPQPSFGLFEWAGLLVWIVAVVGEATADRQLERFKADPGNAGRLCETGLWNHSRHPNYFFEWLVWCAYAVFALASPWGWVALYCPAVMLYLLLRVTGIPALEQAAVARRGDVYRRYQQTTNAFVPWFKRTPPGDVARYPDGQPQ